ncbi:hypothetical protein PsYK624_026060 [Phanerochaete sordida]|uniref:RNI-like protein n=1 Tax=Phanerochaete sordida TaxID=48140 RepID=A0A9P3G1H8_9APHY|nr:hypothetical protein PsYK624_026060 [Phanerochaete sordida]
MELYLERSGVVPIFLTCIGEDTDTSKSEESLDGSEGSWILPYMRKLTHVMQHAERISHLHVETSAEDLIQCVILDMKQKTFPILDYMVLSYNDPLAPLADLFSPLDSNLPRLKALWITGIHLNCPALSLGALKTLGITALDLKPSHLRALADSAPQLDHLQFDSCNLVEASDDGLLAHFPVLRSLMIGNHYEPQRFLTHISAPALTVLNISAVTLLPSAPPELPPPLPLQTVRSLVLADVEVEDTDEDDVVRPFDGRLFASTPHATMLTLHRCSASVAPLLEHLATAVPIALPMLETLVVYDLDATCDDVLLRVIQHLKQHDCPLKAMELGKELRERLGGEWMSAVEEHVRVSVAE